MQLTWQSVEDQERDIAAYLSNYKDCEIIHHRTTNRSLIICCPHQAMSRSLMAGLMNSGWYVETSRGRITYQQYLKVYFN